MYSSGAWCSTTAMARHGFSLQSRTARIARAGALVTSHRATVNHSHLEARRWTPVASASVLIGCCRP
jgi:hypothetical protein